MLVQGILAAAMLLPSAQGSQAVELQPIAMVDAQDDPAELINLGVELARAGETEAARHAFEKVRSMRVDYTLETTDGRFVYPADLARKGLQMLENGEFTRGQDRIASR
tara:strand:+ start:552 stop:875 length:324 start_codon:yes stop_codon:yes gene_type:complete